MYEHITYNSIMQAMLDRIDNTIDKREGSIIYNALAPCAMELQQMYIELDNVINQSFADTQSRAYLIRRAKERGIKPKPASHAIVKGSFNVDVPIGSRFKFNNLNFEVFEKINTGVCKLKCENIGSIGNVVTGELLPIEYIDGLTTAKIDELLVAGEDEESTESIRQRYFDSFNSQAFGGNIADYKQKVKSINGVGGVKVYPAWNGAGTVKLEIISSNYGEASSQLIEEIQNAIDPKDNTGTGVGLAPIGHNVTVVACDSTIINITTSVTLADNYDWSTIEPQAKKIINDYFSELSRDWENSDQLVIRILQIESRLVNMAGVVDVTDTKINEQPTNLIITNLPKLGNFKNA